MPITPTQQPGISGKKLTLLVTLSMVLVGAVLGYTLWCYSQLDAARADIADAWRAVASGLDSRYHVLELKTLAPSESEGEALGLAPENSHPNVPEFAGQLRMALDGFRSTSQISNQQTAAELIESLLQSNQVPLNLDVSAEPGLVQAVAAFNESLQEEKNILNSVGGRILDIFMEFPQPRSFKLAE